MTPIKSVFGIIAVVLILLITSVPMESADADDTVQVLILDSSGTIYKGKMMDSSKVDFQTELTDEGLTYTVLEGAEIPTPMELYLRIVTDIGGTFNVSLQIEGNNGWMRDSGITCTLSGDGTEGSASVPQSGSRTKFTTDGATTEFVQNVDYKITFNVTETRTYSEPPGPIEGLELTYQADSDLESHMVRFDPAGGAVSGSEKKEVITGRPIGTLPTAIRDGYQFAGWYWNGERIYATTVMGHTDMDSKARWIPIYTLTFDPLGGTVSPMSKALVQGSVYGELPTPTKDSYRFLGWFTSAEGGASVGEHTIMGDSDVTIYAHWSPTEHEEEYEYEYVDKDGNTVHIKEYIREYPDGATEIEVHTTVTDPQGRILKES
ncbi:MAG: InlB B-repeat-containing protein, partial [Candidatus Methanomethylophilaceae archaeon]|nr:InlB B-repeat-containing protein [Candidatus Methanomethylophilaceae archaeon]